MAPGRAVRRHRDRAARRRRCDDAEALGVSELRPHRRGAAVPVPEPGQRRRRWPTAADCDAGRAAPRRSTSCAPPTRPARAASCCASSRAASRWPPHPEHRGRRAPPAGQAAHAAADPGPGRDAGDRRLPAARLAPEITRIRGVSADSAPATLLERGLLEEAGRSQFGAVLYRTTPLFLKLFGLDSLDDLPDPGEWDPSPTRRPTCASACSRPARRERAAARRSRTPLER